VHFPLLRQQTQPLVEHSSPRLCIRNSLTSNSSSCWLNLRKCYNFEMTSGRWSVMVDLKTASYDGEAISNGGQASVCVDGACVGTAD
jgi:hypothetical protein